MFFKEFSGDVMMRTGLMVPAKAQPGNGYCSLYYFRNKDAQTIRKSGSSKGLNKYPVWTNRLVMDYDDGDATLWDDFPKIAEFGAPFRIYTSGGKGYHVEIHIEPMVGLNVPFFQRVFVTSHGFKVDLSLYQSGRLISNIGRVHPKTQRKKALIMEFFEGQPLVIPQNAQPPVPYEEKKSDTMVFLQAIARLNKSLKYAPGIGNRHTALWGMAKDLAGGGLSHDTALELLLNVNKTWPNPKEDCEVEAAVEQAYR